MLSGNVEYVKDLYRGEIKKVSRLSKLGRSLPDEIDVHQ
jgi:hypothetical protein